MIIRPKLQAISLQKLQLFQSVAISLPFFFSSVWHNQKLRVRKGIKTFFSLLTIFTPTDVFFFFSMADYFSQLNFRFLLSFFFQHQFIFFPRDYYVILQNCYSVARTQEFGHAYGMGRDKKNKKNRHLAVLFTTNV